LFFKRIFEIAPGCVDAIKGVDIAREKEFYGVPVLVPVRASPVPSVVREKEGQVLA